VGKEKFLCVKQARKPKKDILIVCCGKTEEIYFNTYKLQSKGQLLSYSIKTHALNPELLVKEAKKYKDRNEYVDVWVIFDYDNFKDFDKAIYLAEEYDMNCVFSNIAIEYWFLLHFETKKSLRTGYISTKELKSELSKKLGFRYGKNTESVKSICKNKNIEDIEELARIGHDIHKNNSHSKPSEWCSCTNVYLLTEYLRIH
jgi:hypothetical protein